MKYVALSLFILVATAALRSSAAQAPDGHPDTDGDEWTDLFAPDLTDAVGPKGIWSVQEGILTASEDEILWTGAVYGDADIDLEFMMGPAANSGVFVYGSHLVDWVENSVEIQILDNGADEWLEVPANWKAGSIFGHVAAGKETVKPDGQWNRMTIRTQGRDIWVVLNGELVTHMNMDEWTSGTTNPDGSAIPDWLAVPKAKLPSYGHIGLQGKHGDAPIYFRNLRVRRLD